MLKCLCTATILATLCAAGPVLAEQAGTVSEAEAKQTAAKIAQAWDNAYNAGKPADIVALFVRDCVYLTPGGTMLTNHQDMEKALTARQQAGWTKETIKVVEARPTGSDVLSIVDYVILGTGPNDGKQIGGYAALLLTREGSDWHIKLVAANLKPVQDVTGMAAATAK